MKTYKQFKKFLRDKCWNERDYGEGIYDKLIYDFLVEEVKENKEELYGRSIEEQIKEHLATPSILEKLRYGIDKLTIYCRSIYSADCSRGEGEKERNTHMIELSQVLELLTSLETNTSEILNSSPQFTPGQEVSIHNPICSSGSSSTADKWTPSSGQEEYKKISDEIDSLPIEDKIEPELLAFDFDGLKDSIRTARENNTVPYVVISKLLELCQALSRQKTTK